MPAIRRMLVLSVCLVILPPTMAQEPLGPKVYRKALTATVLVVWEKDGGSGWVVDKEKKLVVTNYHVVRGQTDVLVFFPRFKSGKLVAEKTTYREAPRIKAKVIRTDPQHDLALLQLERVPKWATDLKLAGQDPGPGERLHSIGHPAKSDALFVYSTGFVRQVYQKRWALTLEDDATLNLDSRVVEMGSPINPGDSGGPVMNDKGELVGVTQSLRLDSLVITYAIAVSEVKAFMGNSQPAVAKKPASGPGRPVARGVDQKASARR